MDELIFPGLQFGSAVSTYKRQSVTMKELIITSGDKRIYGMLYEPAGEGKHPAVLMSHGYNGSHTDWVNEGEYYSRHGYVVYAYDFCGGSSHSLSSGRSTEMSVLSEKEDLMTVFDYVRKLDNVDPDRIVLFGGSQGGFVSSLAAAKLGDSVRALVMYFPALCIPDNWKENYPDPAQAPETFDFWGLELGRKYVEDAHRIDVYGTIGQYKGDVLILHGDEDDIVPFSYSEKAAKTYEKATLVRMEGEGHGFTPEGGEKAMQTVLDFLDEHCLKAVIRHISADQIERLHPLPPGR